MYHFALYKTESFVNISQKAQNTTYNHFLEHKMWILPKLLYKNFNFSHLIWKNSFLHAWNFNWTRQNIYAPRINKDTCQFVYKPTLIFLNILSSHIIVNETNFDGSDVMLRFRSVTSKKVTRIMYHHQQNKCYPQRCLLAHFEATLDFSRSEFTCP